MTSPLRRAREEVAVNIAVTGFVARTLGTQTQKYARQLESLEVSAKGNRQESRRMKEELSLVRLESGEGSEAWHKLTKEIVENDDQHKIIQTDIQSTRLAQRRLQVATGESLAKIRGFGIILGVTSLALGAASGAIVKLSGNMQELNTIAFQTNTSVQDLQFSARRFGVILGDPDMGKAAAINLANIKHQIDLVATGLSGIDLGNLALAGISYSDLIGKNIEQTREVFLGRLRASRGSDVASLRSREAIRRAVGGETFTALTAELKSPGKKYNFNIVTGKDIDRLEDFRKEYGAIRVGAGQFAEVLTLSLVPAIGWMFTIFGKAIGAISGFILAHKIWAKAMGTVVVFALALIGVFSGFAVFIFSMKLAVQGLTWAKIGWAKVTNLVSTTQIRLYLIMRSGIVATAIATAQTLKNAAATKIAGAAHAGWAVIIGILSIAKAGLAVALIKVNIQKKSGIVLTEISTVQTGKNAVVTGIAATAHAVWAVAVGAATAAQVRLGMAMKSNIVLTVISTVQIGKNAVVTGIAKVAYAGWAVVIGVLTFVKSRLSIALIRNNALMVISFIRTTAVAGVMGVVAIATAAWIVVTHAATAAQMALNVALWANPIGLIVAVIVLAIAALGGAIYAMVRWRREIWDFFGGWGKAVLLVLGPIGMLAAAIITVIQNWNKMKNLGPFSSGEDPAAPAGGGGWRDKVKGSIIGGIKTGFGIGLDRNFPQIAPQGGILAGKFLSQQISPGGMPSSNLNNRTVNVHEKMDINNTFNINGAVNAKEVAEEIADRQREANTRNVSFRDVGFALE